MPVIGLTCWDRPFDTNYALQERTHMLSSTYTEVLVAAGATPVLLPSIDPRHVDIVLESVDGLVITGGGDMDPATYGAANSDSSDVDRARDQWELALVAAARRHQVPVLGVCRGCQVLNVALGGTLRQHVWGSKSHPHLLDASGTRLETGYHDVSLEGLLVEIYSKDSRRVNSLHHQAIDIVGDGLEVVATTSDGEIEAVVATGPWPALGVQWHPERPDLTDEHPLFRWITEQAAR